MFRFFHGFGARKRGQGVSLVYVFLLEQELFRCKLQKTQLKSKLTGCACAVKSRGTTFRHGWIKELKSSLLTCSFSVVFILKWLSPSWWQRWSHSSKFRDQTQQLEHISFLSSAPQGLELTFIGATGVTCPCLTNANLGKGLVRPEFCVCILGLKNLVSLV